MNALALQAQPAPVSAADKAPTIEAHLNVATNGKLSGGFLQEYFLDMDQTGGTRLNLLLDRLLGVTIEERDAALKDFKKANKVVGPKGKEIIDPVASTRSSEIKTLWAGLNLVGLAPKDWLEFGGYHRIVSAVRNELVARKINPDGEVKKEASERKADKAVEIKAHAMAEALIKHPRKEGETDAQHLLRVTDHLTQAADSALAESEIARANAIVEKILKESPRIIGHIAVSLQKYIPADKA